MKCLLGIFIVLAPIVWGREFQFHNKFDMPIWVGILGSSGKPPLHSGGVLLKERQLKTIHAPDDWSGKFWARTGCSEKSYRCETGDCGHGLECNGSEAMPPVTLVELTLRGYGGSDFYDISLVDGFNVPASITPLGGTGDCKTAECPIDLNPECPSDLRLIGSNGEIIACQSSCNKFNTDEYCCRGIHGQPEDCQPTPSAIYFKTKCQLAFGHVFDKAATFSCKAPAYKITFG